MVWGLPLSALLGPDDVPPPRYSPCLAIPVTTLLAVNWHGDGLRRDQTKERRELRLASRWPYDRSLFRSLFVLSLLCSFTFFHFCFLFLFPLLSSLLFILLSLFICLSLTLLKFSSVHLPAPFILLSFLSISLFFLHDSLPHLCCCSMSSPALSCTKQALLLSSHQNIFLQER